jgi:DNA-binding MarR family transcriptional regulator
VRDQFKENGGILLDNAVAFWVERVHAQGRLALYALFAEREIEMTPERWAVLVSLWDDDGPTQRELAARTLKDEPTVSRILDGIESRGWIVRRPDPGDGRTRRIHLTPKGKRLEGELVPAAKKLVARLERGISEEDLVVTRRTLRKMFQNLSES